MEFRLLRADEIDVRISTVSSYGVGLLLYKDARCDQNILDETVGAMNWQRHHSRDNANCIVSIWDQDKQMWIEKEDTGTESYTEREKGLASDSFKRACFNWGIGRELYTAPDMFVYAKQLKKLACDDRGKYTCKDRFHVEEIEYDGKRIQSVVIKNETMEDFLTFGTTSEVKKIEESPVTDVKVVALENLCRQKHIGVESILKKYKVKSLSDLNEKQHMSVVNWANTLPDWEDDGNDGKD